MKPEPMKEKLLVDKLKQRHGSRFEDLQTKGKEFARCLKALEGFQLIKAGTPPKHVGRVIVDGVLQVAHDYEKQVRPAVDLILKQDQAVTI